MKFLHPALLIHTHIPNYPFLKTALVEKAFLCLRLLGARRNLSHPELQTGKHRAETDQAVPNPDASTSLLDFAVCSSSSWKGMARALQVQDPSTEAAVTSCSVGRLNRRVMVYSKHQPPDILSPRIALIW